MKSVLTFILFVFSLQGMAQLPDYYVYLVSGDATLTKSKGKPVAIKQKQLVYKSDVIILKKGTELTLVDKNASFLVLKAAGTYKGSELAAKGTTKTNDGVTSKYLKLLFHELLDPNHDFEKLKKENIAGVWGGVSRGDECGNRIFPVNGVKTSVALIVFKWHATSPSSGYSFVIYDAEGKELIRMNVKDTVQRISVNETLQGKTGKYFWRVTSEDGTCEDEVPVYFEILTTDNEDKLVTQLISQVKGDNLEMQLQQIDKLEKNAFIHAAASQYDSLVKANPANKALVKSYVVFLLKYGFDEEAKAAWKL